MSERQESGRTTAVVSELPSVSDAAVEEIARGMFGPSWDQQADAVKDVCLRLSRGALEAAQPFMGGAATPDDPEPSRKFSPSKWAEWAERHPSPAAFKEHVAEVLHREKHSEACLFSNHANCGEWHTAVREAAALLTAGVFRHLNRVDIEDAIRDQLIANVGMDQALALAKEATAAVMALVHPTSIP